MFWRSKSYAEAIQLIATLRTELEAQAERYSKLLEQSAKREQELMDRLMKLAPAPFPLPTPRQVAPVGSKDAPRQQFNFPGRRSITHPPPRGSEGRIDLPPTPKQPEWKGIYVEESHDSSRKLVNASSKETV